MKKKKVIWVMVNCNSTQEAKKTGEIILKNRLACCFDVFRRGLTTYFWPPKSNQTKSATGALLILETFHSKYPTIQKLIKQSHSDKLPFIGYINIHGLELKYLKWMRQEIKPKS